ncbi:taurine dioxygenase [Tistlia consotensis]|uniref:Taurine dioxygenase n=1 Tax=Tistlia consotensis USBA 355 TaxID=560819 RepID=A0A1Y6CXB9_9PROT|nr:TauD/TfdA family dioxygenase [Tistlia consotensis]SMF83239.1 taurine dioxygenase [Tistlia consotensis USBA 355]SNS32208.1 taurine dioxygenase [Tistlia consotensis]
MAAFALEPVTPRLGARLTGLDLGQPISEALAEDLRQTLAERLVLFLPGQNLSMAALKRATAVFGPLTRVPYIAPSPEDPDVVAVLKEADEAKIATFGGDWHSDFSFLERPPGGSLLQAVELPPVGGDTLWADQVTAWATLPEDLKEILTDRRAIQTGAPYGVSRAPSGALSRSIRITRGDPEADRERAHPAVRRHPVSGRAALFVNPTYTTRLDGMTEQESAPILARLYAHMTRPEFCCRHRWRPGDLTIWDNRATLHFAVNDYDGHRRLLWRTTFEGEVPIPA